MTGTVRKISKAFLMGAAIAALSGLPAAAYDVDPAAISLASEAMAWVPPTNLKDAKSKPRHVRHARAQPARVASLAKPGCGWSPCERQFVLMLGVGF